MVGTEYVEDPHAYLDVETFQSRDHDPITSVGRSWAPIIYLADINESTICSKNVLFLTKKFLDTQDFDAPYASILMPPYHRKLTALQSGAYNYAFDGCPKAKISENDTLWEEITLAVDNWPTIDKSKKLQLITILMQLTNYDQVLSLVGEIEISSVDPLQDHILYEVARCVQRLNPNEECIDQMFGVLSTDSDSWPVRLMSLTQYLSRTCRISKDLNKAKRILDSASTQSMEPPPDVPEWLGALTLSRFHRAVALFYSLHKKADLVMNHIEQALTYDEAIVITDMPLVNQYREENLKICLESMIKYHTYQGSLEGSEFVEMLRRHDSYAPDSFNHIGEYYLSANNPHAAASSFITSAQFGGGRAAITAFRAASIKYDLDDLQGARKALDLALALNPLLKMAKDCIVEIELGRRPAVWQRQTA